MLAGAAPWKLVLHMLPECQHVAWKSHMAMLPGDHDDGVAMRSRQRSAPEQPLTSYKQHACCSDVTLLGTCPAVMCTEPRTGCLSGHETQRTDDRTSKWGGRSVIRAAQAKVPLPASAMMCSCRLAGKNAVSCAHVCHNPLLHLDLSSIKGCHTNLAGFQAQRLTQTPVFCCASNSRTALLVA
jgi:hypothetical protein